MINLASMIDVTFLLLMYFMVASVLAEQESRLSTALATQSKSSTADGSDLQPQNLDVRLVDSTPAYSIGSHTLHSKSELFAVLRDLPHGEGLFVRVYDDVPVSFAVAALQAAHDAGFAQVTYVPSK